MMVHSASASPQRGGVNAASGARRAERAREVEAHGGELIKGEASR
jgi:hypothetical protein